MNNDEKNLEIKVGLFVFIGLVAIAIMAIQFGRLGQGLNKFYQLKVEFPNASGLLKNSDIQLAGAVVGHVGGKPTINEGRVGSVTVDLFIRDTVKIPRDSTFQISSSGMMGDKFVDIVIPENFDDKTFDPNNPKLVYTEGETIKGTKLGGFDELTKKGEIAMEKLAENLDEMKIAITKLQGNFLSEENLENVRSAFASIKTTGDNFAEASKEINDVVIGAKEAVNTAKETMASAKGTMETANHAANDIRAAISDARSAISSVQTVLKSAQSGSGAIPMLLSNREVSDNLRALIANIRRHGVLFYRDSAKTAESAPTPPARTRAHR